MIPSMAVSILSQPEGRELPRPNLEVCLILPFQSSPSPKAGSYFGKAVMVEEGTTFQSSPSPKAGSYLPRRSL